MDIDDNASSTVTYAVTVLDRHTMLEISSRGIVSDVRVSCEFSTEGAAGDAITVDVQVENGPSWKTVGQVVYSHVDSTVAKDDVLENDDEIGTVFQGPRAHDSCWMGTHLHQGWDASSPETTVAACESASSPVTANSTVVETLE